MILKKIVQRVQNLYSKGRPSDDSRLSDRHIVSKLDTTRSLLLKREADQKRKFSDWTYQTIPCIEMCEAPIHECPCVPVKGCTIIRSKEKIPKPIHYNYGDAIESVTSLDGSLIFSRITWREAKYKSSNAFTGSKPAYYIRNDYLYILDVLDAFPITMTAVFEDPIEAEQFASFCDSDPEIQATCPEDPLSIDYPIDAHLIEPMLEMAVRELVQLFSSLPEDNENNAKDTERGQE